MNELLEIAAAAGSSESAVLATIVQISGSAYRRPGARMLFPDRGDPVGLISGGCLEADLAERAGSVFATGEARTVVYDMRSPDDIVWGLGLGCSGEVRVLLERIEAGALPEYLLFAERCARERRPGVVATVFGAPDGSALVGERVCVDAGGEANDAIGGRLGEAIVSDARAALERKHTAVTSHDHGEGRFDVLVEYVAPAVSLVIFGAGQDALPLVRQAKQLGWQVTVCDDRPAYARPDRFPEADAVCRVDYDRLEGQLPPIDAGTAVVVMTHHFLHDLDLAGPLLSSEAAYVGFLGPRKRTDRLLEQLAERGVRPTREQLDRMYAPVGIDIGSETPQEIALSVLAEIRAVLAGRPAGFLRHSHAPLHDWPR